MNEGKIFSWMKRQSRTYLILKALKLDKQGKHQKAIECCNKALNIIPNDPHILGLKAQVYRNLEEYDSALEYIEQALRYSDDFDLTPHCMYIKTQILCHAERYEEALEYTDRSINSGTYKQNIYALKGSALYHMYDELSKKQLKKIIDCYNKALEYEQSSLVLYNKGLVFFDIGEYEEALKCFKQALSLKVDKDPIAKEIILEQIAHTLYETGMYEEALEYCRKFIKKGSKDPNLLYSIATTLYNLGSLHKALDAINASISIDPTIPDTEEFRQDIISSIKEQEMEE